MKAIFLVTTGLLLLPLLVWIHEPSEAQKPAHIGAAFATLHAASLGHNEALQADDERIEREIEAERWDSPAQLRELRAIVAAELAEDQKQAQELHSDGHSGGLEAQIVTADRDALARIDTRLQLLAGD